MARPPTTVTPERVALMRLSEDRMTWKSIADKLASITQKSFSTTTAKKLYRTWKKQNPDFSVTEMFDADDILNKNLSVGRKRCAKCTKFKLPAEFCRDRTTARGYYLHSNCRECVAYAYKLPERISAQLLGRTAEARERREEARRSDIAAKVAQTPVDAPKRLGRPPKLDPSVVWFMFDRGLSKEKIAAQLEVTLEQVNRAMDRIEVAIEKEN